MKNIEPIPIYTESILRRLFKFIFNCLQSIIFFFINWIKIRLRRHSRVLQAAKRGEWDKIYRQRLYDTFIADYETITAFSIKNFFRKHFLSWRRVAIYFVILTLAPWFIFIWFFLMFYKFIMRYLVVFIDILVFEWLVFIKYLGSPIVFIYIFSRDLFLILFYWSFFRYPRLIYDWFSAKKSEDWWLMIMMPFVYFTAWFWDTVVWAYWWLYWIFHWIRLIWWQLQWYKYRYDIKGRPALFKFRRYLIEYLKYLVKYICYKFCLACEIIIEFWIIEILIRFLIIDVFFGFLIYDVFFKTILVKFLLKYFCIEILLKYFCIEIIKNYFWRDWVYSSRLRHLLVLNFYFVYFNLFYFKLTFYQIRRDLILLLLLRIFKYSLINFVKFFSICKFWWNFKKGPLLKRIFYRLSQLYGINKIYYWKVFKLKWRIRYLKSRYYLVFVKLKIKLFISNLWFLDYKRYYRFLYSIYIYVDASIILFYFLKTYRLDARKW
jgi:hypothetical protein